MAILYVLAGKSDLTRALLIPVGGVVFLCAFWLFREAFKRRSGGLGFR
jgi:predicted membrane-bound mannosyltransferase